MTEPGTARTEALEAVMAECACLSLRKVTRAVTQLYDQKLRPTGLRSTQLPILVALGLHGPTNIGDLAEELVTDRTTLTRNLRPLVQRGLLEIHEGDDRRTRFVSLTRSGQATVQQALPLWAEAQGHITQALNARRLERLRQELAELTEIVR